MSVNPPKMSSAVDDGKFKSEQS